ncbi:MAG: sugar ABC transporter permease [Chloroflexi bacterium]|nr:sugar ABC transporter permease [Chloroflexota bacterium]
MQTAPRAPAVAAGRREHVTTGGLLGFVDRHADLLFPAPAVLLIFVLLIFPLVYTFVLSFHYWFLSATSTPRFIGLDNYARLLADERFHHALWHTFYFTALAVSLETLAGLGLALIFNRNFPGRGLLRTALVFPMMSTPMAVVLVWALMYEPTLGIFNYFVKSLGFKPILFLADKGIVIPAVVLVDMWFATPFVMLVLLAGLSSLPIEPYEAAVVDGASRLQLLRYLTLPLLRPTIVVAVLFRTISALQTFDHIYALTGGGPDKASETVNLIGWFQIIENNDMGYASTILVALFLVVGVASLTLLSFRR